MGRGIPGDLTGELTKRLGGNFRAPGEHTFSKSIVLVMPDVFLKLRGLKQCPKTFGATIARVPGLSCLVLGVSQGSVLRGRGEGTGFCWPRHPGRPYQGVSYRVPEGASDPLSWRIFKNHNVCNARCVFEIL